MIDGSHRLTFTTDDVKTERSAAALAARSQAAQALLTDCQALLAQGSTAVTGVGTAGEAAAGALEAAVAALVEKEVTETAAALQTLAEEVDGLVKEGGDAAARVGKEMCARLSKEVVAVLVAQSTAQTQALLERAKAYEATAAAGAQEVAAAFAGAKASVEATLAQLSTLATEGQAKVRGLAEAHQARAAALKQDVASFAKARDETETAAEAARAAFVREQQAAVAAGAQAILAAVQERVGQLVADCDTRGQAFDAAAAAVLKERTRQVEGLQFCVMDRLEEASKVVEGTCASLGTACFGVQQTAVTECLASLDATQGPAHAAAVGKAQQEAVGLVRALEGKAAEADTSMQATLAAGQGVITSIEAETRKVEALLTDKGAAVASAMSKAGHASAVRLTEQGAAFASLVQTRLREPVAAGVAAAAASIAQTEGAVGTYGAGATRVEPPTNGTPTKREYPAPGPLSATRPHAEIVAEARARAVLPLQEEAAAMAVQQMEAVEKRAAPVEEQGLEGEEASPNKKPRLSAEPAAAAAVAAAAPVEKPEQEAPAPAAKTVATGIPAPAVAGSKAKAASTRIPRPSGIKPLTDIKNVR